MTEENDNGRTEGTDDTARSSETEVTGEQPERAENGASESDASTAGTARNLPLLVAYLGIAFSVVIVFYPGRLVPDTIDMCDQALRRSYTDWHSPVIAWFWGFLRLKVDLLFLAQIVGIVLAVAAILGRYLRPLPALVATALIAWSPATLGWLAHVGKDQWFCAFVLGMIATLGAARRTDDRTIQLRFVATAIVLGWFAVAARGNAPPAVLAALLPFRDLLTPRRWSHSERASARMGRSLSPVALIAVLVISTYAFSAIVVRPFHAHAEQTTMSFDLAGMSLRTGEILLPDQYLDNGATLDDIDNVFDEGAGEYWLFLEESPLRYPLYSSRDQSELRNTWLKSIFSHPLAYLSVRTSYVAAQLGISQPHPGGSVNDTGSKASTFGMSCYVPERAAPTVQEWANKGLTRVDESDILRGWFLAVVLVACTLVAGRRKCPEVWALLCSALVNELTLVIFGISATYRYVWFLAIAAQIALALTLTRVRRFARGEGTTSLLESETTLAA